MVLPFVRELLADVEKTAPFARAVPHLKAGAGRTSVSGLTPTVKSLLLALLHRAAARPLLVIVADNRAAEDLAPVLEAFCDLTGAAAPQSVVSLPAYDVLPFENLSPHPEIQEERATALWKIATGAVAIVVAPVAATLLRLRDAQFYAELARVVRRGETLDVEALVEHLGRVGYAPADVVEMPGQYARRGGILDVYPPEAERPVRIEFFGDEVESLRRFDPATQRSSSPADEAVLLPLTETPPTDDVLAAIHARLTAGRLAGRESVVEQAVAAGGVAIFPGWELLAPLAAGAGSLFDLLPEAAVLIEEGAAIGRELDHFHSRIEEAHERSGVGNLARPAELYLSAEEWRAQVERRPGAALEHLALEGGAVEFASRPTPRFHGSVAAMVEEVRRLREQGQRVLVAAANLGEVERLAEVFTEYGVPFRLGNRARTSGGETWLDETAYFAGEVETTVLVRAFVPDGVALPEAGLVLFGTRDLFDESETVAPRPLRPRAGGPKVSAFLSDFRDLAVGDYVVHVDHGIGQYRGLKEIRQDGAAAEFMLLEYAEEAKLYVPLTRLDLVQKYRSAEGGRPALARLGSGAWARTKARVKKAVAEMADELLKLYAERRAVEGHAFSGDAEWQREFEDAFEFSETPDQEQAVGDVKRDMQAATPMDRLLVGDVGYGKTEVAMRAAFKAVADNKQAAVLAPTTVLVFQHYETFRQRFAAFPITVEMLSRFRSPRQQKQILARVEAGKVDVLIGTHRLLSKDVRFADLGLLVVDEEQRFGVRHKERLKQLKKQVDVLTLSATPIPRTLHMSLVGLRDMSVIETPPKDRIAIQTVVAPFSDKIVQTAIAHELERQGQAYFLHNRVETIYEMASKIRELAPRARVLVGHGQMPERELEKVMLKFMRHEADVLVATTIVENGLDIPLCNTILIHHADRLGLSELYQLRGRVGRSNRRAYAYLLVPPEQELSPLARRRLAALKEFSDLGAGFKLAALDLELRGAGTLLGGQQSGHVDAVGFELYTSMLERSVRELKGEVAPEQVEAQLNLGLNVRIPEDYVAEENQRLRLYKRVAGAESEAQLRDVRQELEDRYGPPPAPVRHLLQYAALRQLCRGLGVASIERRRDAVQVRFTSSAAIEPAKLARFVAAEPGAQFSPAGVLKFSLKTTQPKEVLARLRSLLEELSATPAVET